MGTYRLTAHSFVAIRLFVSLIVFTPGTLLNIYVLLIPVISEHWTGIGAAGWLLLLIFGMGSQPLPADLILQGEACGWCTILKDVRIVYALDLYSCTYMYEVITVKNNISSLGLLYNPMHSPIGLTA